MKSFFAAVLATLVLVCPTVPAQASPEADPAFIPGKPLPYAIYDAQKDVRKAIGRTKYNLRIILADHNDKGQIIERARQDDLTNGQLAATAIAAAKQCAKDTGADFVGVVLESQFIPGYNTSTQLAVVDYAPDGKGVSGKDNMKWDVRAAEHGLTAQQLTMQSLWSEWRGKFQKDGSTDEDALSEAIGKKLNIAPEDVNLGYMFLYAVPAGFAEQIEPQPGLMPKKGKAKKQPTQPTKTGKSKPEPELKEEPSGLGELRS